ncbi:MAG: MerR family transcriptional regulator [Candidatus Omnitrophota bacterium]|jgi:DNA-binding transcriptional MerR regulator
MEQEIIYTTKEAAEKLGISKQTLFRYEKKGIFPRPKRNSINHWRQYSQQDLNELSKIIRGSIE